MYLSLSAAILSLFSSIPQLNSSTTNSCSLLGPVFPPPSVLSTDPNIIKAGDSLALALETLKQNASTTGYGPLDFKDNSFSIQVFSLYQQEPTHQYHYTAPSLSNSTVGTRKVDQDSIYRAGSVTKLLTVWLVLIEAGEAVIHDPITKYVPELAEIDARGCGGSTSSQDNTDCVMWKDVTVGDLGSHMAGIQKERKTCPSLSRRSTDPQKSDIRRPQCSGSTNHSVWLPYIECFGHTQLFSKQKELPL